MRRRLDAYLRTGNTVHLRQIVIDIRQVHEIIEFLNRDYSDVSIEPLFSGGEVTWTKHD